MHVRKFHSDSLDEALKEIKHELGPDAIILKTVTNKGIKGAFKKKKIEITAAISEKSYVKKARIDHVLNDEQKSEFYSGRASYVSNMIDNHAGESKATASGYGSMGLNRPVATVKKNDNSFLETGASMPSLSVNLSEFLSGKDEAKASENDRVIERDHGPMEMPVLDRVEPISDRRVDELEKKIFELTKGLQEVTKTEPVGIYQLRTTLRSLDISETYIQSIIRKAIFELNHQEQEEQDVVFEYALNEMMTVIKTDRPLFSSAENVGTVTILLSDTSCGQTSMLMKIGALKNDSVLIKMVNNDNTDEKTFTQKVFNMNIVSARSIPEIVSECRKAIEEKKTVIVDYGQKSYIQDDETLKFIEGIKRSFGNVEVLVSLSAIHSELYNRKVIAKYRTLADGMVISHLDLCLNFGALFNIANDEQDVPFKFFGTGEVVPDDLEAASPERILAGIFQF